MHKFLTLVAGIALLGFTAAANAGDQPAELTAAEMDGVTAGVVESGSGSTYTRTINRGAYSIVFDGSRWSLVWH